MSSQRRCGMTRRGFLVGAGAGVAVGAPIGWFGLQGWQYLEKVLPQTSTHLPTASKSKKGGMPGRYPGRVVEVRHPGSVDKQNHIDDISVRLMIDRGMRELTRMDDVTEAWRSFFEPDDVVGIKVNPVGRGRGGLTGSISSPAVLREIVAKLRHEVGIKPANIIVFERYAQEFRQAGYEKVMGERQMDGIRWYASAHAYDGQQVRLDGQNPRDRDPHVVGYDPDIFATMGFASPDHDPRDDRRFRSHVSTIVSRMVNKFITIPCLKDHRSAGVTLALKNMSHGMNNNVARSHLSSLYRPDQHQSGPNQCNTFIPTAVAQAPIREKATLHIMDGLIGVYEGGPGCWNRTWSTWQRKSLFFATDPVAMDHVCWHIIDAKRKVEGWPSVAEMGLLHEKTRADFSARLASLAASGTPEATLTALAAYYNRPDGRSSEVFDRRQPEHVMLAGLIGLGVYDPSKIESHQVTLPA